MLTPLTQQLIQLALLEDLATGDITTDWLPALATQTVTAKIVSRQSAIASGLHLAHSVFHHVDTDLQVVTHLNNGESFDANTSLLTITGTAASILKAERLALNLLQHACGIATHTQRFVAAVADTGCRVAHTRKTLPGLRQMQLDAVRDGGGASHRASLGHAVMLKDNHIAAMGGDIGLAVQTIRQQCSHTATITVEVDRLDQLQAAIDAEADIVLLDNFSLDDLRAAVAQRNQQTGKRLILEASGGVTLDTIRAIAETGVDVISTSQLTMAAPPLDIGLDF